MTFKRNSVEYTEIKAHVSWGANSKVNNDAMIFNASDSKNCPSYHAGLCQVGNACFMQKCESRYPALQPYHMRQGVLWQKYNPVEFGLTMLEIASDARTKKFTEFRFGESGDFKNPVQLQWFATLCQVLRGDGITTYGYTARTDLDLTALIANSQLNLSNDDYGSAQFQAMGANRFKAVLTYTGNADAICPCETLKEKEIAHPCGSCNFCKVHTGLIEERLT